jgi:hypothetical protein
MVRRAGVIINSLAIRADDPTICLDCFRAFAILETSISRGVGDYGLLARRACGTGDCEGCRPAVGVVGGGISRPAVRGVKCGIGFQKSRRLAVF